MPADLSFCPTSPVRVAVFRLKAQNRLLFQFCVQRCEVGARNSSAVVLRHAWRSTARCMLRPWPLMESLAVDGIPANGLIRALLRSRSGRCPDAGRYCAPGGGIQSTLPARGVALGSVVATTSCCWIGRGRHFAPIMSNYAGKHPRNSLMGVISSCCRDLAAVLRVRHLVKTNVLL
jgi:hypothetical protein